MNCRYVPPYETVPVLVLPVLYFTKALNKLFVASMEEKLLSKFQDIQRVRKIQNEMLASAMVDPKSKQVT